MDSLGFACHRLGEHLETRFAWERALAIVDAGQAHAEAQELRRKLAGAGAALSDSS